MDNFMDNSKVDMDKEMMKVANKVGDIGNNLGTAIYNSVGKLTNEQKQKIKGQIDEINSKYNEPLAGYGRLENCTVLVPPDHENPHTECLAEIKPLCEKLEEEKCSYNACSKVVDTCTKKGGKTSRKKSQSKKSRKHKSKKSRKTFRRKSKRN
jgi:hypothetical protein